MDPLPSGFCAFRAGGTAATGPVSREAGSGARRRPRAPPFLERFETRVRRLPPTRCERAPNSFATWLVATSRRGRVDTPDTRPTRDAPRCLTRPSSRAKGKSLGGGRSSAHPLVFRVGTPGGGAGSDGCASRTARPRVYGPRLLAARPVGSPADRRAGRDGWLGCRRHRARAGPRERRWRDRQAGLRSNRGSRPRLERLSPQAARLPCRHCCAGGHLPRWRRPSPRPPRVGLPLGSSATFGAITRFAPSASVRSTARVEPRTRRTATTPASAPPGGRLALFGFRPDRRTDERFTRRVAGWPALSSLGCRGAVDTSSPLHPNRPRSPQRRPAQFVSPWAVQRMAPLGRVGAFDDEVTTNEVVLDR